MTEHRTVTFEYTNWHGETAVRRVLVDRVVWEDNPGYGYSPGWFLRGTCLDRNAQRTFALDPRYMRPLANTPLSPLGHFILAQVR